MNPKEKPYMEMSNNNKTGGGGKNTKAKTGPNPNWKSTQTGDTAKNSAILREKLGLKTGSGLDAHHIVPSTKTRAQEARDVLDKYQININDKINGVGLVGGKGASKTTLPRHHRGSELHSNKGVDAINERITNAQQGIKDWTTARKSVLNELEKLKTEILNGTFP